MWEISNSFQILGFLRALFLGGIFCVLYDFLRALRKNGMNSDFSVFIQDIIYFIVLSPVTFCFLLATTNGELRGYFFIGVILGFIVIRLTVSFILLWVYTNLISMILKFFNLLKRVINRSIRFILKIYSYIEGILRKNLIKIINCFKKLLKK